jgi:hypothetical protein
VSVEVSEGTEVIVVEEDGEVSSVSSRVPAPAVCARLWQEGTDARVVHRGLRSHFSSDVTTVNEDVKP